MEPIKLDDEIFNGPNSKENKLIKFDPPFPFMCDTCATPLECLTPFFALLIKETDTSAYIYPLQHFTCPGCFHRIAVINVLKEPLTVTHEFQSLSKGG